MSNSGQNDVVKHAFNGIRNDPFIKSDDSLFELIAIYFFNNARGILLKTETRITEGNLVHSRPGTPKEVTAIFPSSLHEAPKESTRVQDEKGKGKAITLNALFRQSKKKPTVYDLQVLSKKMTEFLGLSPRARKERRRDQLLCIRILATTGHKWTVASKNKKRDWNNIAAIGIIESFIIPEYRPALLNAEMGTVRWDLCYIMDDYTREYPDLALPGGRGKKYLFFDEYLVPTERPSFPDDPYLARSREKSFRLQCKTQTMSDEINTCIRSVLKLKVVKSIDESLPSGKVMSALRDLVKVSRGQAALFFSFFSFFSLLEI